MATAEDLAVAALARCAEAGGEVPSTRSVLYRRLAVRQQELYAFVAGRNPDYSGRSAAVALTAGVGDLSLVTPAVERVTHIQILNAGTSPYAVGLRVNPIAIEDPRAALAPRVLIRDNELIGYNSELDLVTSVTVYYARRSASTLLAATTIDLPDQFQELLVIDLARHIIRKMTTIDGQPRAGWLQFLDEEEKELMGQFEAHVAAFNAPMQSRFAEPRGAMG